MQRATQVVRSQVGGLPRTFWILWAGVLANQVGTVVLPFLAFYLTGVRHVAVAVTGLLIALNGAGSFVSKLVGGVLADRVGRRATLAGSMFATAAALGLLSQAHSIAELATATLALGLVQDAFRPASTAVVADIVPPQERARAYGLRFWAINLGFSIAMVSAGLLSTAGLDWLFWLDGGTCAIFGLIVITAIKETRPAHPAGKPRGSMRDVLRDKLMLVFCLPLLGSGFVLFQGTTTLPLAMVHAGLKPSSYGFAIVLNGIAIVVVQPLLGGWLSQRRQVPVLAVGCVVTGVGFGLDSIAHTTVMYAVTVVIWTVGEVLMASSGPTIVAALSPPHLRGRYSGAYGLTQSAGALIAPIAGAALLTVGPAVLWLTVAAVGVVSGAGICLLTSAIQRREAAVLPSVSTAAPTG